MYHYVMEALPAYYVRSEHDYLLAGQKTSTTSPRRLNMARRFRWVIFGSAFCIAMLLLAAAVLGNEPFVPTLAAFMTEWWYCLTAAYRNKGNSLTIISEPSWEGLKGGEHCLRHATRQYTARLVNAPAHDIIRTCKETPVEIHENMVYPDFCQDLGFGRGVWGYWIVDTDEPDCNTKFNQFFDMGCAGGAAPVRHIEARLENLREGDNWQFMCVTTPADIDGRFYLTPTECFNQGRSGVYGLWSLPDDSCSML